MEIGFCKDCRELHYAITNNNGTYVRQNLSSNHDGHNVIVFGAPEKYSPPIRNVLIKLQSLQTISDNEICLFKLALDLEGYTP